MSDKGCIAHDRIAADSALRALYDWPPLRAFIAAVLGVDTLHPYTGPFGSLNINVFAPGQQLGWHFDNADFVTTLMIRPAEAGGLYEYAPGLRAPEDEAYDALARVLDGARAGVRSTWRRAPWSCSAAATPAPGNPGRGRPPAPARRAQLRPRARQDADRAHPQNLLRPGGVRRGARNHPEIAPIAPVPGQGVD